MNSLRAAAATTLLRALWAKKKEGNGRIHRHPLICHMMDTACVVTALWEDVLQSSFRSWLIQQLDIGEDGTTGRILAFWAALHDIGKASPAFQAKDPEARKHLEDLGLSFATISDNTSHSLVSAATIPVILSELLGYDGNLSKEIGVILGAHHGVFPRSENLNRLSPTSKGGESWDRIRMLLSSAVAEALSIVHDNHVKGLDNGAAVAVAGLVSVADWIASNERFFPYWENECNLHNYAETARASADDFLDRTRWKHWSPPNHSCRIAELFGDIAKRELRPVQQAVEEQLGPQMTRPGLVIIEAPTGEGKTEAAVYLADHWAVELGQRGYYFALPTQATSNQMFGRIRAYIAHRFAGKHVNLMLQHGHAALSAEFDEMLRNADLYGVAAVDEDGEREGAVQAAEWFTYRKRGFLAPFGVGTIDQALLSILQTKHFFVRLFGLAHKTVIFDEVHAYDTYMTTLLERLLEWLASIQSSVVILSATLPNEKRKSLLKAYMKGQGTQMIDDSLKASYPRITWALGDEVCDDHIETSDLNRRSIRLNWIEREPDKLGEKLSTALSEGGCAAVICNTVGRAQDVYSALKRFFPNEELDLFHARYLHRDRAEREARVLKRFGPNAQDRPYRMVLVATQVIEQSLDLDFDLMVTDIAPVDLILQRVGRLHRHERDGRPTGLCHPTIWICKPAMDDNIPMFDSGTSAVYDAHILLRSYLALEGRDCIDIPHDVESLIEDAYGDILCPLDLPDSVKQAWEKSLRKFGSDISVLRAKAKCCLVLAPDYEDDIFEDFNRQLQEDNPEVHETMQALTRSGEPSINIVCLQENHALNLNREPDTESKRKLLEQSLSITQKGVFRALLNDEGPRGWRKCPLLRHHKCVILEDDDSAKVGEYRLRLDSELGLIIRKDT